jgi:hypothetical protein
MGFLEALYGSQYLELEQNGKDGNKGRLNGNIFLAVLIMLSLFVIVMLCFKFLPGFEKNINRSINKLFGYGNSGKAIGKILAVPLIALIYFICVSTVGSKQNFKRKIETFLQYPADVQKGATKKILLPFFILLATLFVLSISS